MFDCALSCVGWRTKELGVSRNLTPHFEGYHETNVSYSIFVKHPTRIPKENDEHPDSLTITKQKFRHAPPYAYKISTSSRKSKIWSSNLSAAVSQLWRMKRQSTPHKDLISLEDNTFRANRYKSPSSTKNYYLTTKAVEQSDTKAVKRHKRARSVTTLLWM